MKALERVKHPDSQQRKTRTAISLSFDEFELGYMAFDHSIVDPEAQARLNGLLVLLYSRSKALQFRNATLHHLP